MKILNIRFFDMGLLSREMLFIRETRVHPTDLFALIEITDNENIPVKRLAERMGYTDRHSSRIAVNLEQAGYIKKNRVGKEVHLHPNREFPLIPMIERIISDSSGKALLREVFSDQGNITKLLSLLSLGGGTVEEILTSLNISRSTFYRTIKKLEGGGINILKTSGGREKKYKLREENPIVQELAHVGRFLHPEVEFIRKDNVKLKRLVTLRSRILIHLGQYTGIRDRYTMPFNITQEGLAQTLWTTQPIISKELQRLKGDELIYDIRSHIVNQKRKKKTYHLTSEGIMEYERLMENLRRCEIEMVDFDGISTKREVIMIPGMLKIPVTVVEVLNYLTDEESILLSRFHNKLESHRESQFMSRLHHLPVVKHFYGRTEDRAKFLDFLEDPDEHLMLLSGEAGIGKTTFLARMCREQRGRYQFFYYDLDEWSTPWSIFSNMAYFLDGYNRPELRSYMENRGEIKNDELSMVLERVLKGMKLIVIFDDFQKADERVMDLFKHLSKKKRMDDLKIVLSGRGGKNFDHFSYTSNRFGMGGLDQNSCSLLMRDVGVPDGYFRPVFKSTGGNPLAVELIGTSRNVNAWDLDNLIKNQIIPEIPQLERELIDYISIFRYPVRLDTIADFLKGKEEFRKMNEDALNKKGMDIVDYFVARSLMTYSGKAYRIHDLIKENLSTQIPELRKREYHILAAQNYLGMENDPARIEALHHLSLSGENSRTMEVLKKFGPSLTKRGYCDDLREIMAHFDPEDLDIVNRISYHYILGEVHFVLGNWKESHRNHSASVEICEKCGKERLITRSKLKIAMLDDLQGKQMEAIEEYEEVSKLANRFDQFIIRSYALRHLGTIMYIRGDVDRAEEYYSMAMDLARETKSRECLANAYFIGSFLCQLKKDFGKCETQMKAGLRIYNELGDNSQKLKLMNNLAWLYSLEEDWERALDLLEEMISLSRSIGDFLNKGFGLLNSADIMIRKGNYIEAERRLNKAYHHFVLLDEPRMIHSTEHTFAMLYKKKGEKEKARNFFDKAMKGYEERDIINQMPELLFEYADMERSEGNREKVKYLFERGMDYARKMKDRMWIEKFEGDSKSI